MKPLKLVAALGGEAVSGCSIPVSLTLVSTNPGTELVEVHAEGTELPFEYQLESPEVGTILVGKERFEHVSQIHPPPPVDPVLQPLRSGEAAQYEDDIGAWSPAPLTPGNYLVTARWIAPDGDVVAAAPQSLRIVPATPSVVSAAVAMNGQHLLTAFVNAQGATLYERTSTYGRPDLGHALPRHGGSASIPAVCIATEIDDPVDWRWVGFLEGNAFRGVLTWGQEVLTRIEPSPHELTEAMLLPAGWQNETSAALFVILGHHHGHPVADLVLIPKGIAPLHQRFALGTPLPRVARVGCKQEDFGVLELVRADVEGDQVVVGAQSVSLIQPGSAGPLRRLFQARGELRAIELAPVLGADSVVDVLLGDTLHRVPLSGGPVSSHPLDALDDATAWSLPAVPHPRAPVLAQARDTLWLAHAAEASSWTAIAQSHHPMTHPRVVHVGVPDGSVGGRVYATWFDAAAGYRVVPDES